MRRNNRGYIETSKYIKLTHYEMAEGFSGRLNQRHIYEYRDDSYISSNFKRRWQLFRIFLQMTDTLSIQVFRISLPEDTASIK